MSGRKEGTPPEKQNLAWIDRGWSSGSSVSRGRGARDAADREEVLRRVGDGTDVPGRFEGATRPRVAPPQPWDRPCCLFISPHLAPIFALPRGPAHASAGAAAGQDAATRRRRNGRRGLAAVPSSASCVIANAIVTWLARGSVARDGLRLLGPLMRAESKQREVVRVSSCAERVARGRVDACVLVRRRETDVRGRTHACPCVVSDVRAVMPGKVWTRFPRSQRVDPSQLARRDAHPRRRRT